MKSKTLFLSALLCTAAVLSACGDDEPTNSGNQDWKPEELDPTVVSDGLCPVDYVDFAPANINVRFCYSINGMVQTSTKDGVSQIFITDADGLPLVEMSVAPSGETPPASEADQKYIVQSYGTMDGDVACNAEKIDAELSSYYTLNGSSEEETAACRDTEAYKALLTEFPAEYFVFFKDDSSTSVVVSAAQEGFSEQDMEMLLNSLQPTNLPEEASPEPETIPVEDAPSEDAPDVD